MDATMNMASTATKMGLSAASKTTSMTTSLASRTADLTTRGLSKTATLTTKGLSRTKTLTTRATAGAVHASMGAVGVSKDATVMLFTSIAEQIPGYEGEKTKEEVVKERPPPVMSDTTWSPTKLENEKEYTVQREIDSLVAEVEQAVSKIIHEAGAKVNSVVPAPKGPSRPPMHGMYLKALSCVMVPARVGEQAEFEMWTSDDFKQLKDRCSKCDKRERVSESMHDLIKRYLENTQGKEAIMAGLNARMAIVDKDPFRSREAFMRMEDYEEWKANEKSRIDSEKVILKRYVKKDIVATVHELKMGNRSSFLSSLTELDEAESAMAQLSAEDRRRIQEIQEEWCAEPGESVESGMMAEVKEGIQEAKQTMKNVLGQVKMFVSPMKNLTKQVVAPVKSVAKKTVDTSVYLSTGGYVTGDMMEKVGKKGMGVVKQQVVGKAQIWVSMSFGTHNHSSEQLVEEATGSEAVHFQEAHVQWHLEPGERGAFKIYVYRKSKFGLNTNLKGKEEVVGTVTVHWDDLVKAGDMKQALEQWFECEEEPTRQVRGTVRLITSAIEGSELPIFDPRENLLSVFSEMFKALRGPDATHVGSLANDWLLDNMRTRCGASLAWERLLGITMGLQLGTSDDLAPDVARAMREERMVQLLEYIKLGANLDLEMVAERNLANKALMMLRKQVRNEIIAFPFKYVRGDEEREDEPALLSLLLDIEEEVTKEIERLKKPLPPSKWKPSKQAVVEAPKPAPAPAPKPAPKPAPSPPPAPVQKKELADIGDFIMSIGDDAFAAFDSDHTQDGGYSFAKIKTTVDTPIAVKQDEPPAPSYPTMLKIEKLKDTQPAESSTTQSPAKESGSDEINVLRISLMRFANVYYGEELVAALQKCGMPLPQAGGQLGCKQIKRMAKRVHMCIIRLEECMGGVIPHDIIVECVAKLVDMLTVDVAGIIASYHVSNQMYPENESSFEDGSDEQLLLKLHHRANMILATVKQIDEGIDVLGLATATAPVLKAWVLNMRKIMFNWMQTSTSSEAWQRLGEETYHSHSVVDVFGSAHQSVETFAALKMGQNSSVRSAFLQCLGDVCCKYMECMHESAQMEQAKAAAEAQARADKTGSMAGMMSHMGSAVVAEVMFSKSDFHKMTSILTGGDGHEGAEHPGQGKQEGSKEGGMMNRMEHMADGISDYTKWGSGLKNLGSKSIKASMDITKKTVNVAKSATVSTVKVAASATAKSVEVASMGTLHLPGGGEQSAAVKKIFTPKDFYDGSELVSAVGCTRMSNSCIVKEQIDQMVTRLEEAEREHGVETLNDWTLSDMVIKEYEKVKQSIQETFELEMGPLLRQVHNGIRAALTNEGGTPPAGKDDELAPALQAIVDALENNLGILRNGLNDRNFATCLRIIWLSSIDVLQEIINDDLSGDVNVVKRASSVLGQLRTYMHADGAGVPMALIERSSDALQKMLDASLL